MTNFLDLPAEDFAEKFLQILSNPKNNLTKEYLAGGMSDPCSIMEPKERKE